MARTTRTHHWIRDAYVRGRPDHPDRVRIGEAGPHGEQVEIRMIQDIEELAAQLQADAFGVATELSGHKPLT